MAKRSADRPPCVIPGCSQRGYPSQTIPVCHQHGVEIWADVERNMGRPAIRERIAEKADQLDAAADTKAVDQRRRSQEGYVYFVRLNDLIKVGWSENLAARLRSYGASVEVLAHHPGTRDEELQLHRAFAQERVKGREWYADCALIRDHIASVIERWGPPYILPVWTEPSQPAIGTRRRPSR